jgi:alkylated DNA repair protein (DNA oxidative demethylase)
MTDLLSDRRVGELRRDDVAPGAVLLRGWALPLATPILAAVDAIAAEAPFRRMVTPGGFQMSVAMTNCGKAGWVTDRKGYRYTPNDPETGRPWPEMPSVFQRLATDAAQEAGYPSFGADACLINRYEPGTRLSLHQDRNERDFDQPVVSVSLGLPAIFQFGGPKRTDPTRRIPLRHGDVVVWGGSTRLNYHGVLALKNGHHPTLGRIRLNMTLRKAL